MACTHCRRRKAKCDEIRPSCSKCVRLKKPCEYVEVAAKRGPKRRNVKELEDRITSMEAQLSASGPMVGFASDSPVTFSTIEPSTEMADPGFLHALEQLQVLGNPSLPLQEGDVDIEGIVMSGVDGSSSGTTSYTTSAEYQSAELVSLGRYGSLPNDTIINHLTEIYFSDVHPCLPIIHEGRYYTNLNLNTSQKPALCLQYAMWALAAEQSQSFSHLAECFHRRSRLYMEEDELSDHEPSFFTVSHVQCWSLLAHYEARNTMLMRAWMSTRRGVALAQLLGLDILDRPPPYAVKVLPESRDFSEKEERRRTFWSVFCNERWTSSGTGNPTAINEEDILTDLPCSDEAFLFGLSEPTQTLHDALENGLSPMSSAFSAFVVLTGILRRNVLHASTVANNTEMTEAQKMKFWEQHHRLDNLITIVFISRSENLRLSGTAPNPLLMKFASGMHALTLSLHQTAIQFARECGADKCEIAKSVTRCRQKADEIVDLMRSIAHIDYRKMYPFTGSCLYTAALVFLQSYKEGHEEQLSFEKLRFAMKYLRLLARHWKIAKFLVTQLSEDLEKNGVDLHESLRSTDTSTSDWVHVSGPA